MITDYCPSRDFAQKAKSRGGTLVTRAYIKESTYSWNIQSVCKKNISTCLNRGREESVGNDDVSIDVSKYEIRWRKDRKSRGDRLGRFCDIYCAVVLRYSCVMYQSIPAAPSSPPPGYCGAFAGLVSPGGGAFANFVLPGAGISQPRGHSRAFVTNAVSYQNITTQMILLGKKAD